MNLSSKPIHVWFEERAEKGGLTRRLVFDGVESPDGPRAEAWWHMPGTTDLPAPPVLDSFICGYVLRAAMLGQDLVVHGPLSPGGLYNMSQLLEIRHALSPERYPRLIHVLPDTVVAAARPAGEPELAMAALSGGLDSTFTAIRHGRALAGDAAFKLAGLVLVLGFDIPLEQADRFEVLRRRVAPLAESLGLPLHTVTTNGMHFGGRAWPQSAMPLFGSVLANFSGRCAVGLVSAGAPHGIPRFGISHPPALDALCSNDYFRVVSDGGGFGRADKIEALRLFPDALAGLKVCWQGPDPARNCGVCEKCVMTRLNFLAAGLPDPPCFDTPLALAHIAGLSMPSLEKARDLFRICWNELDQRGCAGPEVDLLRRRLARVPAESTRASFRDIRNIVRRWMPARARHALYGHLPELLKAGLPLE